jgi:hypothetical protein
VSRKSPEQKVARALQKLTGWSYTECLRAVLVRVEIGEGSSRWELTALGRRSVT